MSGRHYHMDQKNGQLQNTSVQTVIIHFMCGHNSFTTIYHQGFFHSVRRNPSLNCLHRRRFLAILGHAGPRWRIRLSLHLVLGLPCRLVHSRHVHSVTIFVHMLAFNRAMCPAHPCIHGHNSIIMKMSWALNIDDIFRKMGICRETVMRL